VKKHNQKSDAYKIGILVTATHPSLDAAVAGFQEELKKVMGASVVFIVKNIQGSVSNAHTVAQSFHADPTVMGIYAVGTLAAQAASQWEHEKPIFIAAVTDPGAAGIADAPNVCGSVDTVDMVQVISVIRALVPSVRSIGILFNSSEANSQFLVKKMRAAVMNVGLIAQEYPVTQESEIPVATEHAIKNADVLWAPTDNTVASTIAFIAHKAVDAQKPLVISFLAPARLGWLAMVGVDYYAAGVMTALCAYDVLKNEKSPSDIGFLRPKKDSVEIDKHTAAVLQIKIPADFS